MKYFTTLLLATSLCVAIHAQAPMTFNEALNKALEENELIKASDYNESIAQEERKAAIGLRMPHISATGMYNYMSQDIMVDLNNLKVPVGGILGGIKDALPPPVWDKTEAILKAPWDVTIQDRSFATIGGSVTMPIYSGGKINAANNAAKIKSEQAKVEGTKNRNTIISELTERYYGLVLALQVEKVRKQVVKGMEHHLEDAKKMEQEGVIARADRLYAESHLADAQKEMIKAEKLVATLRNALANTMNSEEEVNPISTLYILDNMDSSDYYKQLAIKNNPILQDVSLKKSLAMEGVKLHRSEFLPHVALVGMGSVYNYQLTPLVPRWSIGVGVSFKIFDGLGREHKYRAAKNQVNMVSSLERKAQNDILTLIEKLYNEIDSYGAQIPAMEKAEEFASEYLRLKNEGFKEGICSASEVIDAQLYLAKVRTEKLQTAYYYDLMLCKLLEACGTSNSISDYAARPSARQIRFE